MDWGISSITLAAKASSSTSRSRSLDRSSTKGPRWSKVNSLPITEAMVKVSLHRSVSRSSRLPITSRTPSGIRIFQDSSVPTAAAGLELIPTRPSWTNSRTTSVTNRGLPSVWRCTASTIPVGGAAPDTSSMNRPTSGWLRPLSNTRWKSRSLVNSPSDRDRGCLRDNSMSR